VFDPGTELCDRWRVRRLMALLLVLAFVTATAVPAFAACSRGPEKDCCCDPPSPNTLCAPDCCGTWKAPRPVANLTAQSHPVAALTPALTSSCDLPAAAASATVLPDAQWLIGLHARAAPRLPLRI
jgi:hypothetical protein